MPSDPNMFAASNEAYVPDDPGQLYLAAPPPPSNTTAATEKQVGVRNPEPATSSKTASGQVVVPTGSKTTKSTDDGDDDHDEWLSRSEQPWLSEYASFSEAAGRAKNVTVVYTNAFLDMVSRNKRTTGTIVGGTVGCFLNPGNCAVAIVNAGANAISIGNTLDQAAVLDKAGNAANDAASAAIAGVASAGQRTKEAAIDAFDEASKIPGQIGAKLNATVSNMLGGGGGGGGIAGSVTQAGGAIAQAGGAIGTGFSNIAYAIMIVGGIWLVYKVTK